MSDAPDSGAEQNLDLDSAVTCDRDRDRVVYTRGVSSVVYDEQGDTIGHVDLLDCDDLRDEIVAHKTAAEMDGYTAVYESSEGSYHVWHLRVSDFDGSVLDALELQIADADHIQQSKRRERYVLRCAPKVREGGERYKDAPRLLATYDSGDGRVSAPHYWLVRQHGKRDEVRVEDVTDDRLTGDRRQCEIHSYMTVTDETKEVL